MDAAISRSSQEAPRAAPGKPRNKAAPRPYPPVYNLLDAGSLLNLLLPHAGGERMAVEELRIRDGCRRWRNLLGALRRHLLVSDGLGELSDPQPAGVAGGAVGR